MSFTETSPAETLNLDCGCVTLDAQRLREQLGDAGLGTGGVGAQLFSQTVVFGSEATRRRMAETVAAIERIAALPSYQAHVWGRAGTQPDWGPLGVCMGYDFHVTSDGPKLIEINTNAGGLLLNIALACAQKPCGPVGTPFVQREDAESSVFDMFRNEWRRQRGSTPWRNVLIVDTAPTSQFLYAEFVLFQHLFQRHGVEARIAPPDELEWRSGQLWHHRQPVDMVYNRLTDFGLQNHQALRCAYEAGAVVMTPHPRAHALLADKRNLVTLSQDEILGSWGASSADRQTVACHMLHTQLVQREHAADLWTQRRQLFFKPVAGYGAKGGYRGDKLTRRVWDEILQSDFVAQALAPPSERMVNGQRLKYDLRAYTYDGQVQWLAARIYAGQTTNFRTEGGGFAPVVILCQI